MVIPSHNLNQKFLKNYYLCHRNNLDAIVYQNKISQKFALAHEIVCYGRVSETPGYLLIVMGFDVVHELLVLLVQRLRGRDVLRGRLLRQLISYFLITTSTQNITVKIGNYRHFFISSSHIIVIKHQMVPI